ncbi:MAG TPA: UDP-3-O-(3-hydroxymyristoyl)glucosamine N-acyltransferase [Saprospiraceae bacterium]|nr:UDP-3-O-(3-hydroxymyristoyl)glucosamine N-acyltransferase [Saprospiraceae bacterium]HMQ85485.1 UDP-3-O-(3-hydroxymyristoyl)glucosamine N-acyltransferase [Saprospiraceae bacterium]
MQLTAKELAQLLNGTVEGNPEVLVSHPSKIEEGGTGSIAFLGNLKYEPYAYTTTASILLVNRDFQPKAPIAPTLIRVNDVYAAMTQLFEAFGNNITPKAAISELAFISPDAHIDEQVSIGPFAVIEAGAHIGRGSVLHAQVYVGKGVIVRENALLYPGVKVMAECEVGRNCILQPNVVIGGDGFGFAPQTDGTYKKIPHLGKVILEDDVEIGANTTIDRATMGVTRIKSGVKMDNLIQIAHNVEVGANTVIAAQTGVAGSTKIGNSCRIGGQVGFSGHLSIADGTQIQAQSGIAASIEQPNQAFFGSPAIGYTDYIKAYAVFKKLPDLYKTIHQLELRIHQLEATNQNLDS